MSQGFDINVFVLQLVVILMGLSLHEFSHAYFADLAGDPTPRMMGRVTLNPLKHLDPIGTIMLIFTSLSGIGFGWGKPVMVDPRRMRNPRWDHFISVAAGPASNLLQAVVYAGVLRLTGAPGYLGVFLLFGVYINLGLAVFNLVPL
ncbi:MAG: site-2 protease family protein, partial [Fimbriimonas ginsengisoli]|nr:site-2 protease family protein [Fimbriimonas ginsengisoli]